MSQGLEENFVARSKAVIRDYIRSVLLVDDNWPERMPEEPGDAILGEFEEESGTDSEHAHGDRVQLEATPPDFSLGNEQTTLLEIEKSVLDMGVLFSGVRYTGHSDLDRIVSLARRADVLVLDWHLSPKDDGREAIDVLTKLGAGGLRFVCVFTGDGDVATVHSAIAKALGETSPAKLEERDFRVGSVVVAIRNKDTIQGAGTQGTELFQAAVDAISSVYSGYVQLALLELVQRHKDQLPNMLDRFGKEVDSAFAYEATDELSPLKPGGALVELVLDEWRAALERSIGETPMEVMSEAGLNAFLSFTSTRVAGVSAEQFRTHFTHSGVDLGSSTPTWLSNWSNTKVDLGAWVGSGMRTPVTTWTKKQRPAGKWALLRSILGPDHVPADNAFLPLLRFETLFQEQRQLPVRVTQGTILRCPDGSYLICVTPLCDAFRPDKIDSVFTFVGADSVQILSPNDEGHEGFGCVVHDGKKLVCLHVRTKPTVSFVISSSSMKPGIPVVARPWMPKLGADLSGAPQEVSGTVPTLPPDATIHSLHLLPVSQLRPQHALALAQAVTSDASRVGVDRVEFVRTKFKR